MQENKAVSQVPPLPQYDTEVCSLKEHNPFSATVSIPSKSAFQGLAQHFHVICELPRGGGTHSHSTERAV